MSLAFLLAPLGTPDTPPSSQARDRLHVRRAPAPQDEIALAEGIRASDGVAYEAAIRRYYTWLHGVAMSYVRSEATAEDVVDGVFARVWERRDALQPGTRLGVYLLVAVRRAALDAVRNATTARRRLALSRDEVPGMGCGAEPADVRVEHDEAIAMVWQAIEKLPERAKLVMLLRWRQHWEWPQVAQALGVSVPAAQMQHARALKALREQLPQYLGP